MFPFPRQEHLIFCLSAWGSGVFRSSYVACVKPVGSFPSVGCRENLW